MSPVVFDKVLVNEGDVWNPATNKVKIPYTGYYLVHFGGGLPAATQMLHYMWTEDPISGLVVDKTHSGIDTVGVTKIRRFVAGEELMTSTYKKLYSDALMQTTFMGILLYED